MIIIIIAIFTLTTFLSFMFIKNTVTRWILGSISFILLCLSVFALTLHIDQHWGMKDVTSTRQQQIFTAGNASAPYGILIKSEFGTDSTSYIFMYKASETATDTTVNFLGNIKTIDSADKNAGKIVTSFISHIMSTDMVETSKKSSSYQLATVDTAQIITKTTRRVFSSNLMKILFGFGGENNELVKEHLTVEVPKDTWLVLSQEQVAKLTEEAPRMQAQMEAELKANPTKAVQLAELQKSNPREYAKMQIQQIKQLLGIKD